MANAKSMRLQRRKEEFKRGDRVLRTDYRRHDEMSNRGTVAMTIAEGLLVNWDDGSEQLVHRDDVRLYGGI